MYDTYSTVHTVIKMHHKMHNGHYNVRIGGPHIDLSVMTSLYLLNRETQELLL